MTVTDNTLLILLEKGYAKYYEQLSKSGLDGTIIAIGHIVKEDWFNPSTKFKDL